MAYGLGVGGNAMGEFMKGFLQGRMMSQERDFKQKQSKFERVGTLFDLAASKRKEAQNIFSRSQDASLSLDERNRIYSEAQNIESQAAQMESGAKELMTFIDAKPKKGGKNQNPILGFLGSLNPFGGEKGGEDEFGTLFSRLTGGGTGTVPAGSTKAGTMDITTPAPAPTKETMGTGDILARRVLGDTYRTPETAATPVPTFPTQGAAPTQQAGVRPVYRDLEAEKRKRVEEALKPALAAMDQYLDSTPGTDTFDSAMRDPMFRENYSKLQTAAAQGLFDKSILENVLQSRFPELRAGYKPKDAKQQLEDRFFDLVAKISQNKATAEEQTEFKRTEPYFSDIRPELKESGDRLVWFFPPNPQKPQGETVDAGPRAATQPERNELQQRLDTLASAIRTANPTLGAQDTYKDAIRRLYPTVEERTTGKKTALLPSQRDRALHSAIELVLAENPGRGFDQFVEKRGTALRFKPKAPGWAERLNPFEAIVSETPLFVPEERFGEFKSLVREKLIDQEYDPTEIMGTEIPATLPAPPGEAASDKKVFPRSELKAFAQEHGMTEAEAEKYIVGAGGVVR